MHAIAVDRILAVAARAGGDEYARTMEWAAAIYPKLLAWHRFLARDRADKETGLMTLFHGWESGTDNSPRWDAPYAGVEVGPGLPLYQRKDKAHVSDAGQRPTDREYDRYLWLVEEAKRASYDAGLLRQTGSFQVGDVLFTAIFACASDLLASLAARLRRSDDAAELKDYAAQARAAVFCHVDEASGLAADVDLRTGTWLRTETIAGFAPLIAGGMPLTLRRRLVSLLFGERWAGHPSTKVPAAAVDVALLARVQPDMLLARAGVAGLHLAAVPGRCAARASAGGVRAARGVARATGRRDVRRVLPPGDRRAARLAATSPGRRPSPSTGSSTRSRVAAQSRNRGFLPGVGEKAARPSAGSRAALV